MSLERNLLFGLLAMQNGFISRDQLVAAFGSWTADKRRNLDEILKESRALDEGTLELISALAERHLALHSGDPHQSLAKLESVGASARHDLESLNDAQLNTCLSRLPPAESEKSPDPFATAHDVDQRSTGERYVILRHHATGGLGKISIALDQELHREVALKEIRSKFANQKSARARFLREAEITGGLEHPGIVPVYSLGTYGDDRPYYTMKFIVGGNLNESLENFHRSHRNPSSGDFQGVEFRQLLQRFLDVCNVMQYAHDRGVIHRDLKPSNIMLGHYGETLVIDWGIAKSKRESKNAAQSVSDEVPLALQSPDGISEGETRPGSAIGTLNYMSPEQASGKLDGVGSATDVYALGATLYHLLCGQAPIEGSKYDDLLKRVQNGDFSPPRETKPQIPRALEAICLKAMAFQVDKRYANPRDLAADLEHWLADEPVSSHQEGFTASGWRWIRKHRAWAASGLAALILISVVSVAALMRINVERNNARQMSQKFEQLARHTLELQLLSAKHVKQHFDEARQQFPELDKQVGELATKIYKEVSVLKELDKEFNIDLPPFPMGRPISFYQESSESGSAPHPSQNSPVTSPP